MTPATARQLPQPAPQNGGARKRRVTLESVAISKRTQRRILLYGVDGVGKTSFAASAPAPIFLDKENGMPRDVAEVTPRFPLPSDVCWQDILDAVDELATRAHDYKTLVIDTLDWLEPLCWTAVVAEDKDARNIEEVGGGFQKGYTVAVDKWRQLISGLERLRGMDVILLAHSIAAQFKNPEGSDYLRYQVGVHPKAAGLFREWVDAVMFARYETTLKKDENNKRKFRGVTTGRRIMETKWDPAWDAKNRLSLPEFLPLDWSEFEKAVSDGVASETAQLLSSIEAMLPMVDESTQSAVRAALERFSSDAVQLNRIQNKLAGLVNQE